MNTNLDPASERFLAQLAPAQETLARAQREVSSGKRIAVASDAPDQIEPLLQLRAEQSHNAQVQSNLTLAKADAEAADGAIASSIQIVDRALVLANQGANSQLSTAVLDGVAQEVESLLEQMVELSRTTVQGRYIFSGSAPDTPSYAVDWTAPNGVTQLSAAPASFRIEGPGGTSFVSSKSAQEIFDLQNVDGTPASGNVFAALNELRVALRNGDATAAGTAIVSLRAASGHLNAMEAFYGTVENRVKDATDAAARYSVQLQTQLSATEDADIVSATLEMTQASTQIQAALQMRAKLPHTTLFDYLG